MGSTAAARTVTIDGRRLRRWAANFAERHGDYRTASAAPGPVLTGADGERAEFALPYLPWPGGSIDDAVAHVERPRRTLVLIVRRGGYACAVVESGPGPAFPGRVSASKVGSRYVQGRTAAGGWSQQRFARRREKQTAELAGAAADVAARILREARDGPPEDAGPERAQVWLATGGDKALVAEVLTDPRLRRLADLPRAVHLAVGDPGRDLVAALPALLGSVTITLVPGDRQSSPDPR